MVPRARAYVVITRTNNLETIARVADGDLMFRVICTLNGLAVVKMRRYLNRMRYPDLRRSEAQSSEPKLFRTARQECHRICNDACIVRTSCSKMPGSRVGLLQAQCLMLDLRTTTSSIIARNRLMVLLVRMPCRPLLSCTASRKVLPRERFCPLERTTSRSFRHAAKFMGTA